jgi:DNA-binding transcriptional regulator WhiA
MAEIFNDVMQVTMRLWENSYVTYLKKTEDVGKFLCDLSKKHLFKLKFYSVETRSS